MSSEIINGIKIKYSKKNALHTTRQTMICSECGNKMNQAMLMKTTEESSASLYCHKCFVTVSKRIFNENPDTEYLWMAVVDKTTMVGEMIRKLRGF